MKTYILVRREVNNYGLEEKYKIDYIYDNFGSKFEKRVVENVDENHPEFGMTKRTFDDLRSVVTPVAASLRYKRVMKRRIRRRK